MKVVSLFNGMGCGYVAFKDLGIAIEEYHSFEIDKYAIEAARILSGGAIIEHGSVVGADFSKFKDIDIVIGGSPCQGFSFAGKQLAFNDPRSKLFFEFVRAVAEIRPKYFLLENVKMKKEHLEVISEFMGVRPVFINSALLTAQNRQRFYWCNWNVEQPQDKGILLKDIIETGDADREKSLAVTSRVAGATAKRYLEKSQHQMIKITGGAIRGRYNAEGKVEQQLEIQDTEKANSITTVSKDSLLVEAKPRENRNMRDLDSKSKPLMASMHKGTQSNGMTNVTDGISWRKLTPKECLRLQGFSESDIDKLLNSNISDSQLYKMTGNGWTVPVISHILSYIKKDLT